MENIYKWLKNNFNGKSIIHMPQKERNEKLDFEYKPDNDEEFLKIINDAPYEILVGLGFRKFTNLNAIYADNALKPITKIIKVPVIDFENGNRKNDIKIDIGRGSAPTELLDEDQDLILFPGEWYDLIPDKLPIVNIFGLKLNFNKGITDSETRLGCLAYGIIRPIKTEK